VTRRADLSRVLGKSSFYEFLQSALGARASRVRLVRDYVRPRPGDRILDAGCGPAALLEALPDDVAYVGFDPSEEYIGSATSRWGTRGQFFVASVGDPLPDDVAGPFDIVLGVGLLHHLDDDDVKRLCEQVHEWLDGKGTFVTLDAVVHDGQHPLARWIAHHDRGQHVRTPEQYLALVGAHFASVESFLLTNPLRVPYSHFIMRAPLATP
jgi:SAM-dependent methyltransferase